ncbi:glutamine--tRNA ligase/YqeY domain fusion protein [Saprospiraceae bacterium]|nr:glutamine--tRNA ligase/YqeY domain fusion protein [Saprospiraceae bacterium]
MNKETDNKMSEEYVSKNFIEEMIEADIESGKHEGRIHTRFPPEPNGYLHIGHCKAICINFETAAKYGGKTNLRFDDTNPEKEETEYVTSIQEDIKWLGFDWEGDARFTSDYFQQLYDYAHVLIDKGLAYVDPSTSEEMAIQKGTPTTPGTDSPYRNRSIEENKQLFTEMKEGKHADGSMVLRAKIDMKAPNMLLRDPLIYRIKRAHHHRTGDDWCIYPMYDFAHGQSDSIEKITHSLCSLEFMHHRPLYDWLIENIEIFPSKQTEFARMNVAYMVTSKRRLLKLVTDGLVAGWDDPRMSTISGLRRRGVLPHSLRRFCNVTGVAKRDNLIEIELLESIIRDDLNETATRVMVVMDPIKVVITNYPDGQSEELPSVNNPQDESAGTHMMTFSKEIYIERGDFMIDAPKKYFRLAPEKYVRLKGAYIIKADSHVLDDNGNVTEVHCTYFPESKSGEDTSGIKAKGVLHWVDCNAEVDLELRLYDRLFTDPTPDKHEDVDYIDFYNKESLEVVTTAKAEQYLQDVGDNESLQFMRKGYFIKDKESTADKLVFNRTISLRDSWAKMQKGKNANQKGKGGHQKNNQKKGQGK